MPQDAWDIPSSSDDDDGGEEIVLAPPPPRPRRGRRPITVGGVRAYPVKAPTLAPTDIALVPQIPGLAGLLRPVGSTVERLFVGRVLQETVDRCEHVDKIAEQCFGKDPRIAMGASAEGIALGMDRRLVPDRITDMAICAYVASRSMVGSILKWLSTRIDSGAIVPIACFRSSSYDETPMVVKLPDSSDPRVPMVGQCQELCKVAKQHAGDQIDGGNETKSTAKILQTDAALIVLFSAGAMGRLHAWHMPLVCPLQVLDHATADVMKHALEDSLRVALLTAVRRKFPLQVDIVTSDKNSANIKAEDAIGQDEPRTLRLRQPCNVHCLHTAAGFALSGVQGCISGAVAFALAQRPGGAVVTLRQEIKAVLVASAALINGPPPPDSHPHSVHRDAVLELFVPPNEVQQKERLRFLLKGDLTSDRVPLYYANRVPDVTSWAGQLAWALLPRATPLLNTSRWLLSVTPLRMCGLVAHVHNLLARAVPRWLARLKQKIPPPMHGWDLPEEVEVPRQQNPQEPKDWKLFNEQQRFTTAEWVASDPSPALTIACVVLAPVSWAVAN